MWIKSGVCGLESRSLSCQPSLLCACALLFQTNISMTRGFPTETKSNSFLVQVFFVLFLFLHRMSVPNAREIKMSKPANTVPADLIDLDVIPGTPIGPESTPPPNFITKD